MQIDKSILGSDKVGKGGMTGHYVRGALLTAATALAFILSVPAQAQTPQTSPNAQNASSDASPVKSATGSASAVVFMYHRFDEGDFPSTNIRVDQLSAHIGELGKSKYHVMDAAEIVSAIRAGKSLPDRTIGLTVDDAYRTFYTVAWPMFKKAGLPVTLFVSTSQLDAGYDSYMTWDMLRDLVKQGVTVGGHSDSHAHLSAVPMAQTKAELEKSAQRFKKELGFVPELFAYPYGEADTEVQKAVRDAGYKAAFGQQSGGFDKTADMFYLPRFALNEHYGSMDRFELAANSLPLDVSDLTPANYTLQRNPPAFGFTLQQPANDVKCYPSEGTATMSRLGEERVEVRLDGPVSLGRWRINCTAGGPDGRWRWLGMLYTVPKGLKSSG
ncbi:polysaccharide deacetylase family protein [uncultured Thalassospira sp.]|uniref:polysaccharide deacetylase family protein n=1 Tax=uncultured Thalassospira sp. TaxID=404382 RepID=UPI0030DA2C90|tara:strand:- start:3894 stop:5048 length:1155 start_codon:yes stop_codon:yes gene_type:complete